MNNSAWERFEKLVFEIQKELTPNSEVKFNEKIKGRNSGVIRQVDIAIYDKIGPYEILIAMECKNYKKRIDVKTVESFVTFLTDISAEKGVLVSSIGFTKAAQNLANKHKIDLLIGFDTESKLFNLKIFMPMMIQVKYIRDYSISYRSNYNAPLKIPNTDPRNLFLYSSIKKNIGTISQIFTKKWNSLKTNHTEGLNSFILNDVRVLDGEDFYPLDIMIEYNVSSNFYYKDIELRDLKGFVNMNNNRLITSRSIRGEISLDNILSEWKLIEDEEIIRDFDSFKLTMFSEYTNIQGNKSNFI